PKSLEGKSLAPLLREPAASWHHAAFSLAQRGKVLGRTVRTERFRYIEWDAEGKLVELYDHVVDPHEMRNLAAEPTHAATVGRLRQRLKERHSTK
ncbi:MAG: DUF4976 domain-containing protein, partial [Gemmataceae bacterium]|nr:DUF4976 domain-containing protein [Gemmataceae bacterium]